MAIFAHPDDEAFGPAGTLARYASEGAQIFLLTATRGEQGQLRGKPAILTMQTMGAIRSEELDCACRQLGIKHWLILGYPDAELAQLHPSVLDEHLVRFIRTWRPHVLLTFPPHGLTGHPDHIALSAASAEAFDAAGRRDAFPAQFREGLQPWQPLKLYHYVLPASLVWRLDIEAIPTPDDLVTTVVDISGHAAPRSGAIRCHYSQLQPRSADHERPRPRDEEAARLLHTHNFFVLAKSKLPRTIPKETDLFEGIPENQLQPE